MFHSGEQRVSNPAIITWLASTKAHKTCTNKGPETKFPEIFDELFARANSHNKVSMTNETDTPIKLAKILITKKIDKTFSSTRANKVCRRTFAGVPWALGSTTSQAGISIHKITEINSTINPLVVCVRLNSNEFAGDMS